MGKPVGGKCAQHGALFGFDAFFAFLIACFMLYLMAVYMEAWANPAARAQGLAEAERIALSLADIIAKDSNTVGGIGCAYYNAQLHRIEDGVIDAALCRGYAGRANLMAAAEAVGNSGHFIAGVSLEYKNSGGGDVLFKNAAEPGSAGCVYAERFVVVRGAFGAVDEKAKLVVGVCNA